MSSPDSAVRPTSCWWVTVQALITIALVALLWRSVDVSALRALFGRLPASFYLLSLATIFAGQIAYAWRWSLLLKAAGVPVPLGAVIRRYFVAVFVSNFLPSTVGGDAAKVFYLGGRYGYRTIAASVVVDRLLGVGLLALVAAGALWMSPISTPRLVAASIATALIAAAALAVLVVAVLGTGGLPARARRFGAAAVGMAERLQRLRLDMATPLRRPATVVYSALVVAGYAMAVSAIYARYLVLQQAPPPPFLALFAVVTAITVLSNVPISLNGLGLREQLHASLLAPLGIGLETAVAISLLLYGHLVVISLIGLLFWLRQPSVDR